MKISSSSATVEEGWKLLMFCATLAKGSEVGMIAPVVRRRVHLLLLPVADTHDNITHVCLPSNP